MAVSLLWGGVPIPNVLGFAEHWIDMVQVVMNNVLDGLMLSLAIISSIIHTIMGDVSSALFVRPFVG